MARRRKKNYQQQPPFVAEITAMAHDGRGIAHVEGMTTFIDGALLGESVLCRYQSKHKQYHDAYVVSVEKPAPERIEPACPHFSMCGGCSLQYLDAHNQIKLKQQLLIDNFTHLAKISLPELAPAIMGTSWGYRRKARLGVRYVEKKQRLLVGFREKNSRYLAELESCKVLHPLLGLRLRELADCLATLHIYRDIPQVEVAFGDQQGALIIRHLEAINAEDKAKLKNFAHKWDILLYLQPQGINSIHLLYPDELKKERGLLYRVPEYDLEYIFNVTDFTQVNAWINRQMLYQAMQWLAPGADDTVLDLFSGLGNFSLVLARLVKRVIAVEGSTEMVQRLQSNAQHNHLDNVEGYCADLFKDVHKYPWAQQEYDSILLDPARSGAQEIIRYLPRFKASKVLYVSCNPATLARDAAIMVNENGYKLAKIGVMDMFPHTTHVESMVLFSKA